MIAIETKYMGPTNTRGSRIRAFRMDAPRESVSIPYPHELSGREVHHAALLAFLDRHEGLPLTTWQAGDTPTGYVWVWIEGSKDMRTAQGVSPCA
jgi:hypothetical protein